MSEFIPKSLAVLGRQPALGLAELEAQYGAQHLKPLYKAALLDIEPGAISFAHLGGTIKLARVLAVLPTVEWVELENYLQKNIPKHLEQAPAGVFTLGLSAYGLNVSARTITQSLMKIKKQVRLSGKPMRVVPNKQPALNSAQVLHNKLTAKGAWELVFYKIKKETILAQTWFVQDIDRYAARDQARPRRDAKVGMLPPKLAQIIINLAAGGFDRTSLHGAEKLSSRSFTVLDPFCGSGVILQEALLMGYNVRGSDIDKRMVDYAKDNIKWLFKKYPEIQGSVVVEAADATKDTLPDFSALASELYLGQPLHTLPDESKLTNIIIETNGVIEKFLVNLSTQTAWKKDRKERKICLAVPAWQIRPGRFRYLPIIDRLTEIGYTQLDLKHTQSSDLIYYRQNQVVARQLLILKKV